MKNRFIADDGYYFVKADKSAVYENILILGVNDSPENYVQMPIEDALKLKEDLHAKALENEKDNADLVANNE